MDTLIQDFRYGVRMLVKRPAITLVAVISLALGIGANTTIFTMISAVFLTPIPVEDSSRLVEIFLQDDARGTAFQYGPLSYPNARDYRDQNSVLSGQAIYMAFGNAAFRIDGDEDVSQTLPVTLVSGNYFDVLGVQAATGRLISRPTADDDRLGAFPEAVISHGLWERRFAATPDAIGTTILLNSYPVNVVGVAAPNFKGTQSIAVPDQIWVHMSMQQQMLPQFIFDYLQDRRAAITASIGRLAPGVTAEQAQAEFDAISARLEAEYPEPNTGRSAAVVTYSPVNPNQRGGFSQAGGLLMGVVGLVLLIACANVANLLLARAVEREKEIGLRVALGASRLRVMRQLLAESTVLALIGGLFGLLIAFWSRDILWSFRPPFLAADAVDLTLDPRVLMFTVGVSLLTGVVFGLVPSLQASNPDLKTTLQDGGRRSSSGSTKLWLRSSLVVAEIALALVTLVGAGLFVRSMQNAQRIDPGFETERLITMFLNLDTVGYDAGQQVQFFREVNERVGALPGVESAALSQNFPFGGGFLRSVFPVGKELDPDMQVLTTTNPVTPGYFRTLGIPMLRGRDISELDTADSRHVAVINEATGDRFWPGEDPLGQQFTFYGEPQPVEIVGIVENQLINLGQPPQPIVFTPHEQWFGAARALNVRTAGDPDAVMGTVQTLIRTMEPNLAVAAPTTIDQALSQQLWAPRMGAGLLAIFGLVALALAMIGIYGVMSNTVDQRAHEMGIRMALGAGRRQVVRLVVRQGMLLVAIGVGLGLLVAFGAGRTMESMLFDLSGTDPLTFAVVAALLVGVAYLATWVPARRLTALDPVAALRTD